MHLFSLFLVPLLAISSHSQEIGCFVDGECSGGVIVGNSQAANSNDCLLDCKDNPDCHYFTFLGDIPACLLYDTCPELSTSDCEECVSGDVACEDNGDVQCSVTGLCEGDLILPIDGVETVEECQDHCTEQPDCNWFSYDTADNFCFTYTDCFAIDDSCTTCISGETACSGKYMSICLSVCLSACLSPF